MSLSDKDIAAIEETWQELVDWKEGRLVINGLPDLWATNQKAWLGGFTPALVAEVKDSRRRIAELEQANRYLERLRVEASERATVAEQQEREAKEAEERAWTAMRVAREQANGLCQEAENLRVRLRIADQARITFRDKLYGEKAVTES